MEYVDGVPITEYCNQQKLPLTARLKLFQEICEAVQYAHQNLIVHRDLKPNNILITSNASGEASVKLLDFGIAKILDQGLEAGSAAQPPTILTFLTPEYASPEQLRGEPVTTASDVYGLGVLLYELLTGRRPFEIKTRSPQEMLRLIEEQEALRPSHTINSVGAIAETEWLAPDEASRWRRQLSGDLDNVALKALDRDPKRRYQSARQLSEDIARYLNGEPVIAREATLIYRAGKFIKRRKTQIVAVALATVALLGAVAR